MSRICWASLWLARRIVAAILTLGGAPSPSRKPVGWSIAARQPIIRRNSAKRYWLSCGPAEASG